jgi:hypothetical protein
MARSSGVATALAHTSALAPVYLAVTATDGGTMSGNWVTGNVTNAKTPSKVIIREITNDSIGRRIYVSTIIFTKF